MNREKLNKYIIFCLENGRIAKTKAAKKAYFEAAEELKKLDGRETPGGTMAPTC